VKIPSEWQLLSERSKRSHSMISEDVPNFLVPLLIDWVRKYITVEVAQEIKQRVEIVGYPGKNFQRYIESLIALVAYTIRFLDMIELMLLAEEQPDKLYSMATALDDYLVLGGSPWRVADNKRSLERRANDNSKTAAALLMAEHRSYSSHYVAGWQNLFLWLSSSLDIDERSDIEYFAEDLGLAHIEGVSPVQMADAVLHLPDKDVDRVSCYGVGSPVRPMTLKFEHARARAALLLRNFLFNVWMARPAYLNGEMVGRERLLIGEAVDDLESSLYLALCGHYRTASSLLRTACESVLLSIHLRCSGKTEEWEKNEIYSPAGKRLLNDVLTAKPSLLKRFEEHIKNLNQYVHVTSEKYISKIARPYSSLDFEGWYGLYCESIIMMVATLLWDYWTPLPLQEWVPMYKYLRTTRQTMSWLVYDGLAPYERMLP
jgi:hypothetical protein